ncbi:hypothetical protein ANN_02505 [Periplaneta americana]|uniref:Uncharacterized protein n=1 Tax=Periplaneta americana TaxID=6978 RepID=A0ABQ8TYZ7_PERAM|nr:hypothetical protein ANN_02505 [Periplaneta americana]
MDLRDVGYDDRDWINLARDRDRWRAYSDSKPLRQTLRGDRSNNKESFLLNLCVLKRRFEVTVENVFARAYVNVCEYVNPCFRAIDVDQSADSLGCCSGAAFGLGLDPPLDFGFFRGFPQPWD